MRRFQSKHSNQRTSLKNTSATVVSTSGKPFAEIKLKGVVDAAGKSKIAASHVVVHPDELLTLLFMTGLMVSSGIDGAAANSEI